MSKEKISIEYFGASDIGMVRVENQDSLGKFPSDNLNTYSEKGQLFIIADGIGGHAGGKTASSLAVETIKNVFFNSNTNETADNLRKAVEEANSAIHLKAKTSEKFGRMGTTCTAMVLKNNTAVIAQVGDSKVYKIEKGTIEQLTMEHTQLNEMLKEKILTEEEAKNYPSKSALSRALGIEEKVKVDIVDNIVLENGQIFVLCTDGLSKVDKEEVLNIAVKYSPEDSCSRLINLANERGGKDNVTVQVIRIKNDQAVLSARPEKEKQINFEPKKKNKWLFVIPLMVLILTVGFLFGNSLIKLFNTETHVVSDSSNHPSDNDQGIQQNIINDADDPLLQADKLLANGNYDNALMVYQDLLEKEPMNLRALEAVNIIADNFHIRADKLKSENKFANALELYLKIQKIQPENIKVRNSILICENQIKFSEFENDDSMINYQLSRINHNEWSFININKDHYIIDDSSIMFLNTPFEKVSLIKYNLKDAAVSADIKLLSKNENNGAGIIFGYNMSSSGNERYHLLKFDGTDYKLQMVENSSIELLNTHQVKDNTYGERNLRIKCSGNLINIYDGMNLIYSWKSDEVFYGRVGIYADRNVQAEFRNILISGSRELQLNEQVQE
ncbi:MAG: hypothetical protein EHM47_08100 [Ignavibacteriales bacterium]|nr:MAG: hypothetical protein EHM47_08100 [Ignavibacteriales bacterium]